MIDAVGPVLRLETNGVLLVVEFAVLSFVLPDPVAGIDLQALHRRPTLHRPSVGLEGRGVAELFGCVSVAETPVVVDTSARLEELVVDAVSDAYGLAEIHRCALYGEDFSGRTSGVVEGGVAVCKDLQDMLIHASAVFACKVEIGMVGHRHEGGGVGLRLIMNDEAVVLCRGVSDIDVHVAGIAFLAVFGAVAEFDLIDTLLDDLPYLRVESFHAAVQAVRAVVDGQLVGLAVEGELAVFDAVGYASADGVEIGLFGSPLLRCAEAKDDILDFPFAVGDQQFGDLRAEIRDLRFETTAALDRIELDGFHKMNNYQCTIYNSQSVLTAFVQTEKIVRILKHCTKLIEPFVHCTL